MAVKASGANVNLRLRGTAGDGETDINEEINGESTDANANVSLATLSTGAGFDTNDGGHKMSEFFGYASFTPAFNTANFETVTYTGNGGTQAITSKIGKAASFNGSSSYIQTSLTLSQPTTISAWFRTTQSSSYSIVSTSTGGGGGHLMDVTSGKLRAYGVSSTTNVNTGDWVHGCATIDASNNVKIYVNGSLENTGTYSSAGIQNGNVYIGKYGTLSYYFNGQIDQVRIFDKAISSSEVTTLYNETYDSSTKSTTDIFGDGSGIALYELDEDANSSNFKQAAVFDGSSSYVDTNLPSLTNTFSFSAWLYLDNFSTSYRWVFANWSSSSQDMYLIVKDNGQIEFNADGNNGNILFGSSGTFTLNTWHHLVVTMNAGAYTVYLDNVSLGSGSTTNTTFDTGNDFQLGKAPNSSINEWDGKMDDVRIYSDVLTTDEIEYLYNNTVSSIPTDNLTLHYKFDGNATDETETYDGTETSITYSAGVYGGTPTNVNFLGMAFQPDLVWIKSRNFADNHQVADSVRGNTKYVVPNLDNDESTSSIKITSFDSNGFTLGSDTPVNDNNDSFVAWCWKAGGVPTPNNNTQGTVNSTVSANTDAGFSIVSYTATNSSSETAGHGLSSTPELVIVKKTSSPDYQWIVYTNVIDGSVDYLILNTNVGKQDIATKTLNSTVFTTPTIGDFIAYCFHSVDGYQKVGSYQGSGVAGKIVYTDSNGDGTGTGAFRPRFLMIKRTNSTGDWDLFITTLSEPPYLKANKNEKQVTGDRIDVNTTGFTLKDNGSSRNALNGEYIYLAIA